jgi:hypothetical protein
VPAPAWTDEWIACRGAVRPITEHGRVDCPIGGWVRLARCLTCARLETVAAERDPRMACGMAGAGAWSAPPIEGHAALTTAAFPTPRRQRPGPGR